MVTEMRPSENVPAEEAHPEPLLPYYLALSAALSRRGRHGEAANLLQQAQQDAGPDQEQVGRLLVDELVADADHDRLLIVALDLAGRAPLAACRGLTHLRDSVSPAQLPNAAQLLLERDWAAFAMRTETPQPVRADILAAVAELLEEHRRFQESVDLLQTLPPELTADLRFELLLGRALVALRQWPAAQEVLTRAVRILSPSTRPELAEEIRLTSAALYERLGQVSEAITLLGPELTTGPVTRARRLTLHALCLVQTGRPEQAKEEQAAADGLAPETETVVVMGAWVFLGTGDFGAAADRATEGLRRYPESDELYFLRSQATIADGKEVAEQAKRVQRLVERLDRAELKVLVDRTLRLRAEADASLHYFLAVVARAAGQSDMALDSAGKAVTRLGAGRAVAKPSWLTVASRRLQAELLQDSSPADAAAAYMTAGNDAFALNDWDETVNLLSRASRLGALDQLSHWKLAEARFLTSFVATEPMGISERQLHDAVETWEGAFAERLPDVNNSWVYVSRARMEISLARLARQSAQRVLRTLLYCECALVFDTPTPALVDVYTNTTYMLGLYALGAEAARWGLEAEPDDEQMLQHLFVSAINNGDLQLCRVYLPRIAAAAIDSSWHTDAARLRLLAGDPRGALDELAQVAQDDRASRYFMWHELVAHARLGDADGVSAILGRAHERLGEIAPTGQPELDIGLKVCFHLLLGEPDAAATLLEKMANEDSWWADLALDSALVGLLGGSRGALGTPESGTDAGPGGTYEEAVYRFLERTRSFEDVGQLSTMLGELRALADRRARGRPLEGLDASLERLIEYARERLDRGGWPATAEEDLASLRDRPWSPEQEPLARAAATAISARRALERDDWQPAIDGYRSLLGADGRFPEAEQGLVQVVTRVVRRSADGGSDVLADVVRQLTEMLPSLSGVRRRPTATDLLEVRLGDAHLYLADLEDAQLCYEAAVDVLGERAARHVVTARLHVGAALLERPADGPDLDTVLRSCAVSHASAAEVLIGAGAALVWAAAGWQRLVNAWETASARLAASDRPADAYEVALLLAEATEQAGWASRQEGDLELAQAELRRAFERRRDIAGPDDPDVLTRRHDLAIVLTEQGRLADAEDELRAVVEDRTRVLGEDDEDTLAARFSLGVVLTEQGRPGVAEVEFRLVADARSRLLGKDSTATWDARYSIAQALQDQGRLEEAEHEFRDVLDADRRLRGAQTVDTLTTLFGLASTVARLGRFAEAAEEYREVVEGRTRILGADDPTTLAARFELAWSLYKAAEFGPAEAEYRAVTEARSRTLGEDDVTTLTTRFELAGVLNAQGRYADAETELRAVVEGRTRVLGAEDPTTLEARFDLGLMLVMLDEAASALAEFRAVAEVRARTLGPDSLLTWAARYQLAAALQEQGDLEAAEHEYRDVLAAETRLQGAEDPSTLITRHRLATVLHQLGRLTDAEAELRAVVEGRTRVLGAEDPTTLEARLELADLLRELGRAAEADAEQEAVERISAS
jgi:tetratricopeptide (TPR) repeat protein